MCFGLVQKSMILDDLEGSLCTLLQKDASQKFERRKIHTISSKNVTQ